MSKADKAVEPSMDEILASIRKIIADEPAGLKPMPAPARPAEAVNAAAVPRGALAAGAPGDNAAPSRQASQRSAVDDVLGMADHETAAEVKPAPVNGHRNSSVPSWLFPSHQAHAAASPAPLAPPQADDSLRPAAIKPFFGNAHSTAGPTLQTAASAFEDDKAKSVNYEAPLSLGETAPTARGEPMPAADLGSFVPRRGNETGNGLARPTPTAERRQPEPRMPNWPVRAPGKVQTPAPAVALDAPVEPTKIVSREMTQSAEAPVASPGLSELASIMPVTGDTGAEPLPIGDATIVAAEKPEPLIALPEPVMPAAIVAPLTPMAPVAPMAPTRDVSPTERAVPASVASAAAAARVAADAFASKVAAASAMLPETMTTPAPQKPVVTSAITAGATPASVDPAPEASAGVTDAAPDRSKSMVTVIAAAEPAVAVTKPVSSAEKARSPKMTVPTDLVATMPTGGVRTLEDTVVDLLRPMIRQWLDDNMPRMVEKALRVELAASVQGQVERSKH